MLKKMLKAANLKSEKELLKKYPNEIDFLREHGHKLFQFDEGGEPCYDQQGNVVDCEQQRLQSLGSGAYTAMQPFYETLYGAANKYKNERTGKVSDLNSARATAKAFIKHPEVLFMKRHQLPSGTTDMEHNPYGVQSYITPITGGWYPTQWAEPRKERNTGDGWQNFKTRLRERGEERRGRRHRGSTGCWGANCTEAEMQDQAMYGGTFAEGGAPQEMMMQQGPPMEQQGAAPQQEGGGQDQAMQQVVQFIMEALQQKMPQEQIIAQIVEMTGMGQEEAMQILQLVVEKMSGGEQAPEEGAMMPPQGPEQEMMQQGPPPGMRMGGTPCYKCGGMYKNGGSYSGTYDAGTGGYYAYGGAYVPTYSEYAYGGNYPMYADGGEPCPAPGQIRNEQGNCVCGPEYDTDEDTGQCIKKGADSEEEGSGQGTPPPPSMGTPGMSTPRGGFNTGFGLQGKNYNFDYGFGVGADMKSGVNHNVSFNIPKAFRMGVNSGDISLKGSYVPGKSWSGSASAGIPLSGLKGRGDLLRFTGGMGQNFSTPPSSNSGMMTNTSKGTPLNYNAGVEYLGKMFGEKGPNVKLKASYNKENKYGGDTTRQYKKGGEYDMTEKEIQELIKKGYKIQYV